MKHNSGYYSELLRKFENRAYLKSSITKDDPDLVKLIDAKLPSIKSFLLEKEQYYTLLWLKGLDRYNTDKYDNGKFLYEDYDFSRGSLVVVELFGNFNPEFSYEHPAVVINKSIGNKHKIMIAPLTSVKTKNVDHENSVILSPNADHVNHRSEVLLDDVRTISKRRIVRPFNATKFKQISVPKRNEIEEKLARLYLPNLNTELSQLRDRQK